MRREEGCDEVPEKREEWSKHREALRRWRIAYGDYLASDGDDRQRRRDAVDAAIPDADAALVAVQCDVAAPSAATSGPGGEVRHGLAAVVAWLHDRDKARPGRQSAVVLEVVDRALVDLRAHERSSLLDEK